VVVDLLQSGCKKKKLDAERQGRLAAG